MLILNYNIDDELSSIYLHDHYNKKEDGSIGFVLRFVVSSEFVVDQDYQLDCASHCGSRCYIAYCGLFRQL